MAEGGPRLPLALRLANRAGSALRQAGLPMLRMSDEALLERASKRTGGLTDFGGEGFREGLSRLVTSLEAEADLTALGWFTTRNDLVRLLENRLRMQDELTRHPAITAAPVARPLFIVGLPRTGTSILHELLAQDPANRVPRTWEVMYPWPPPEAESAETDPRIEAVGKHFSGVDRVLPDFKRMHPMGARLPQECAVLTQHDFASMVWHTSHRVPAYQSWLDGIDWGPVYASHRRQLQYLQWRTPGERWVLKSPQHLWSLAALLQAYPDARIVQTHRDPVRVLASLANLVATLRGMSAEHVDPHEIGADWAERLADGLERALAVRREGRPGGDQVLDVHFRDFMGDEIGTVRRIYDHFGMEWTDALETRMRSFLDGNPADKHGRHGYRLADAGLAEDACRERFASYVDHFGVEPEGGRS